jgi:hypothetical protein
VMDLIDLRGQIFGRLRVIERGPNQGEHGGGMAIPASRAGYLEVGLRQSAVYARSSEL